MSSRRVVACCAVVAAALTGTTGYAVLAFPLTQSTDKASQLAGREAGPVERRAKPITPENPVPRRTHHVPPDYPAELESAEVRGMVTVHVTLDETGHVAETRVVGVSLSKGKQESVSFSDGKGVDLQAAETTARAAKSGLFESEMLTVTRAVLRAVRQWQYAPPADGPISFPVTVPVGPQSAHPSAGFTVVPEDSALAAGALRVGGTIKPPTKLRNVNPIYPSEALAQRVQGIVILQARIEPDGRVSQAQVLRSIPLLDEAAVAAVRQWEFTPTLLNGQAVPVVMTVTVNFVAD